MNLTEFVMQSKLSDDFKELLINLDSELGIRFLDIKRKNLGICFLDVKSKNYWGQKIQEDKEYYLADCDIKMGKAILRNCEITKVEDIYPRYVGKYKWRIKFSISLKYGEFFIRNKLSYFNNIEDIKKKVYSTIKPKYNEIKETYEEAKNQLVEDIK